MRRLREIRNLRFVTTIIRWLQRGRVPGFVDGMASVLDVFGKHGPAPVVSTSPSADDAKAIRSDWERVGLDLREAAVQFHGDEPCR